MLGRPAPRVLRLIATALTLSLLLPTSACEERTGTFCECPAPAVYVYAPAGTTFEIAGGTCTGRCASGDVTSCGAFLVEAPGETTCTIRATRPGKVTQDSLFVTFGQRGCCGLLPDPLEWEVGSKGGAEPEPPAGTE